MQKKIRWITGTAVLLALLICLQAAGSLIPNPLLKQLVTGTFVNCVLVVSVLLIGLGSGIAIAVISPLCAFLLNIAPNFVTVLPIMLGNTLFVLFWRLFYGNAWWRKCIALITAATIKFSVLYLLVVKVICGVAAGALLGQKIGSVVVLAPPMLKMLPAMFSWPQLVTAFTGGILTLLLLPTLKKALHK